MDSYTVKICSLTQSPEKFFCLNQECQRNDKKYLQCYECLNKQHIGKNRIVRHLDDIIELDKFMKKIQEKNNKKEQFINQLILMCNDFQKEKIQQIELTQKQDIAVLAREKIEQDISQFTIILGQEIMKFKSFIFYSHNKHEQLIKYYQENEQIYIENIKFQYKQIVEKIQTFVFSLDYDIKSQLIKLEDKIKCITIKNKGISYSNIILFIIPFILSYFINQHNFDRQMADLQISNNQKYSELYQQHKTLEIQFRHMKEQLESSFYQNLEGIINNLQDAKGENNLTAENLEKLKLRFEAFKSNQSNQVVDLKKQLQTLGESHQQEKIQEQIYNLNNSFINFTQRYEKELISLSKHNKNLNQSILEPISIQLTQKERLINENRDLIGKIHKNLNIKIRLSNFTLLYDHFFNQYVSLSRMDNIYKLATLNNSDSIICIGGLRVQNQEEFIVAACDFASEIFQPSSDITKARKSQNGEVYWYFVDYFSFGFSPKESVLLTLCDNEDLEDELRFSYWFGQQGRNGGRRIGKLTQLENSMQHKMQIYMLR